LNGGVFHHPVTVGPRQTQRVDMGVVTRKVEPTNAMGGLSINIAHSAGSIIVSHIVFDQTNGLSATMKTFERDPGDPSEQHTMRAPMMALATPDPTLAFPENTALLPQLMVRNASGTSLQATATLDWRGDGKSGRLPLPALNLKPEELRVVNLTDLSAQGLLPKDAYWATIGISYTGALR